MTQTHFGAALAGALLALTTLPYTTLRAQIVVTGGGTNLQAAVSAAPDGALLAVQAGTYTGFTASGKGLTIVAVGQVSISDYIEITNTNAGQGWVLRGLEWPTAAPSAGRALIGLQQCSGTVMLEEIVMPPWSGPYSFFGVTGVVAADCRQLALRDCDIDCAVSVRDCHTVIEGGTTAGEGIRTTPNQSSVLYPRAAIGVTGGTLQIAADAVLVGGPGNYGSPLFSAADRPAVFLSNADVRVLSGTLSAGMNTPFPVHYLSPAITGTGTVRYTGRVTLQSLTAPIVGPTATLLPMPEVAGQSAGPGGTLTASVRTELGDLVILVVGLPGPAAVVPGLQDPFWIDVGVHAFVAIGTQGAVPVSAGVAVPASPAFLGLRLHWGAACQGPATGFQASNPAVTAVR